MPEQIEMYVVVNATLTRSIGPFLDLLTAYQVAEDMTARSQTNNTYTPVPFFAAGNVAIMEGGSLEEVKAKAEKNEEGYKPGPHTYL